MSNNKNFDTKVKSILISQPKPADNTASPFIELEKKYGIKVDFRPFIQVEGVSGKDFRKEKVNISHFNAIIMTSRNAVDHFFRMCEESIPKIDMPADTKYFCISEPIANYLQRYILLRKRKVFNGVSNIEELFPFMMKHKTSKFLMPCSDQLLYTSFIEKSAKMGMPIQTATMFKTVAADLSDLSDIKYDVIAFFSPMGIESLFENFPDFVQNGTRIAAFGASTQAKVAEHKLRLDIAAPTPESPSMPMAIEAYIKQVNK